MFSRKQLTDDFRKLGVTSGDTVMMHASVRSVGEVVGGPDQIHLALKDAVGNDGTIMMLVGCQTPYDDVGRGWMTAEQEAEVLEKLPPFDPLTARAARDNGTLVEFFRTWPGTVVNRHVARFAASGSQAEYITSTTPWDFAFGLDSPLDKLVKLNGKIVLLGSDHDAVTFLHYVEHVADFPGKKIARFKVPVEQNSRRVWLDMAEVDTSGDGAHQNWPDRFFAKLVDSYLTKTGNTGDFVGNAMTYVLSARELFDFSEPIMKAIAADGAIADHIWEST